jgi:drug/metabolite transporter superfamily protein YnfA
MISVKFLLNIYDWLQKNVRPPSAFSWETLILLSVFSYYMSVLSTDFVRNLLANFGWIFLIFGVFWGTTAAGQLRIGYKDKQKDGFPLSPWITGALVSVYIFGGPTGEVGREALIYWPVISAIIAALPDFLGERFTLKAPPLQKRQNLVVLFGTQILLSCWLQFYFVIQNWLVQYPSLVADDFHQSAFVVKWESPLSPPAPRGALILESMEPKLRDQLNARPWSEVERSLLPKERQKLINAIAQQTKQQISPIQEDNLWQVTSNVSSRGSGYNLELRTSWQGPRSERLGDYSLTKSCQINQVYRQANAATKPINTTQASRSAPISQVQCKEVKGWGIDQPRNLNDRFTRS